MTIESLKSIKEVQMSFSANFKLILQWFDPKITWNDLNYNKFLNVPASNILERLWIPVIIFRNTEKKVESPLDQKTRIIVEKKGTYALSSLEDVKESAYYKGSENPLHYERDFSLKFDCQFDLKNYPFDCQVCSICMKKTGKEADFMKLHPKELNYLGPLGLAEYFITKLDMLEDAESSDCDVKVRIFLKRRISQHLQSTYLPSFCLLVIAQVVCSSTFHDHHFHFS